MRLFIAGLIPYFLEKDLEWFRENENKIKTAAKTQQFFLDNTVFLEKGARTRLFELSRKLDELGYEKVFEIENPGEFSQKGGLVFVFPINSPKPARIDFFGNFIENIEQIEGEENSEKSRQILQKKLKRQKFYSDIKNLKPGDFLVHLDHGVGRFGGMETLEFKNNLAEAVASKKSAVLSSAEFYVLEYAENDRLYVPVGMERKLSRYVGFSEPRISKLTSSIWQTTKRRAKEDAEKIAKELLELYAERETSNRKPYLPDTEIEKKLAENFLFVETPDQLRALEEIRKDMEESEKPMDRIVCGDVGFGKTEIALRAMAKAASSGRQSAMLVPTTILAHQHFRNFSGRLKNTPVSIAMLSRLQSKKEKEQAIEGLRKGTIDILIGTHSILSEKIGFKNLGLLVIDDEQKFGVKQKEKLKKVRPFLDVLSLSATPIPRTLYLSLSSLKEISLVQLPPEGRLAIRTQIGLRSEKIAREAIAFEMNRGGQTYFLHNRIETIKNVSEWLAKISPRAKISITHAKLGEKELIKVMEEFRAGKSDILLATTIIESGLDMANVNTIIVDDVSRLGLSQAYQIKGRVGRAGRQAFAYFFHPKKMTDSGKARIKALQEAEELGSGYKIALQDMEIRGAGNILGREQSGTVNKIGLNLYCQILSEAIDRIK